MTRKVKTLNIDLHGYSVQEAQMKIHAVLSAVPAGIRTIRFITGHGKKHPRGDGKQGILKEKFPTFIQGFNEKIEQVKE